MVMDTFPMAIDTLVMDIDTLPMAMDTLPMAMDTPTAISTLDIHMDMERGMPRLNLRPMLTPRQRQILMLTHITDTLFIAMDMYTILTHMDTD